MNKSDCSYDSTDAGSLNGSAFLTPGSNTPRHLRASPLRSSLRAGSATRGAVGAAPAKRPASACSEKKTVSFGCMPTDKKVSNVQDCLKYMQAGCELVKVRSNARRYRRSFTLDADFSYIRWTPTNKKPHRAKISIDTIKEVKIGRLSFDETPDETSFCVNYGADEALDVVANSAEEAQIWVTGLLALVNRASGIVNLSADDANGSISSSNFMAHDQRHQMRDAWLRGAYQSSLRPSLNCMAQSELIKLTRTLNPRIPVSKLKYRVKEADAFRPEEDRGKFSSDDFLEIFKDISTRPEVYFLMVRHANKDYLDMIDFQRFLETEQGLAGITDDETIAIAKKYEPCPQARTEELLTIDGFTAFLLSSECDIFDPAHSDVCHSMHEPLTDYFIASSYNTYLLLDQLKGACSIDGYVRALKAGCRYIEVDVWEDEDGGDLVVYHGHTQTPRIKLPTALQAIDEYAFDKSEYPLIIHLEAHCTSANQRKLAQDLRSIFGPKLYTTADYDEDGASGVPSPAALKHRILIRGKRLPADCLEDQGQVTDEDEAAEACRSVKGRSALVRADQTLTRELSDLCCPFLQSNQCLDSQRALGYDSTVHVHSLNEAIATRLVSQQSDKLVSFTRTHLVRVYPSGVRVDSSNFNPQEFWNCGVQLVSMNYQTPGLMMDLHDGRFLANGGCGYIVKPQALRDEASGYNLREGVPGVAPQVLHLKVISAQQLPRPKMSTAKGDSCDPYVVIEIFGLPMDCAEERTRTIHNDSYNPVFDETFEFHIVQPELALLRFLVLDDEHIGDDFIGQYTLPLECVQTGYRHVTLLSTDGEVMPNTTLFVYVALTNKRGGGKSTKRGRSVIKKRHKIQTGIKQVGIKQIDDILKAASFPLVEAIQSKSNLDSVLSEYREMFSLAVTAPIALGTKQLHTQFGSTAALQPPETCMVMFVHDPKARPPVLALSADADASLLPDALRQSYQCMERTLAVCGTVLTKCVNLTAKLNGTQQKLVDVSFDLDQLCAEAGLKDQKAARASDNFTWNVRCVKAQVEAIARTQQQITDMLAQFGDMSETLGVARQCPANTCCHFVGQTE